MPDDAGVAVRYDPYAYETHEDPYPIYASLRDDAPAYVDEARGFWALSRYDDVRAAIDDWHTFSSTGGITLERGAEEVEPMLIEMDPPRHTRAARLVSRSFTPSGSPTSRGRPGPRPSRSSTRAGTGRSTRSRTSRPCCRWPSSATMLGIPDADQDEVRGWSDAMLHREAGDSDELTPDGLAGATQLYGYFHTLIARPPRHPARRHDQRAGRGGGRRHAR